MTKIKWDFSDFRLKILDRYFLKEFFKPFLVCLTAFLLCMVVIDLLDNINDFIQARVSFGKITLRYLILLPAWIVQVMPITLLLSLLYALSQMSKNGELTAMRASGLDLFRLMGSYFVIGLCFSMQMLSLNLAWAPEAMYKAKVMFEKNVQKEKSPRVFSGVTYHDIAANRYWAVDILDIQEQKALGISILQSNAQHEDLKTIRATSGVYKNGSWIFYEVDIYDYTLPKTAPIIKYPEEWAAPDITESPRRLSSRFEKPKRMSTRELLDWLRHSDRLSAKKYAQFSTEIQSRISFPIANFVVFLIGVPFGIVTQRKGGFLAIVNAIIFFFVYYGFSLFLVDYLSANGRLSPWIAAWLPNILFTIVGIFLIRRIR